MEKMTMRLFLIFSLLPLLGLTVAGQEAFELLSSNEPTIAISLNLAHLPVVSSSVLHAERWVRAHVLAHHPRAHISTVVVGIGARCNEWRLVLISVKNLHHSFRRWGLENEIKVTPFLSSSCFPDSGQMLGEMLTFLKVSNFPLAVDQFAPKGTVFAQFSDIRVIGRMLGHKYLIFRRMLSSTNQFAPAYAPMPETSAEAPMPFCVTGADAPGPVSDVPGQDAGLWCVAKPAVPQEKLQEAVDFACGEGGADCNEIRPNGDCFSPDNMVAHASYAFNSYWQKMKRSGGTCSFDGTAILVNSDPSFLHCKFELS